MEELSLFELDWLEEADSAELCEGVFGLVESALVARSLELPEIVAVFPSRMIWILFGIGEEDDTRALYWSPAITWGRCVKFSGSLSDTSECNLRIPRSKIWGNGGVVLAAINGCALQ